MRTAFLIAILLLLIAFTALTTALAGSRDDGNDEPRTALERLVAENRRGNAGNAGDTGDTPEEIWTATVRDIR